jgi:hypothetical protein
MWDGNVTDADKFGGFYAGVTDSAYFDWLSEYDTPSQKIGRGSFVQQVVDPSPPSSTSLSDGQIQAEIAKLLDSGTLPANSADSLYMVHFPSGVSITSPDGGGSCEIFCAYHGTFTHKGQDVFYGVVPDQGGACAGGCGFNATQFENTTEVASHELIEAVTDCAVGLATTAGPPLAWYDSANGEIGDICNGSAGSAGGYTVQLEWSNKN